MMRALVLVLCLAATVASAQPSDSLAARRPAVSSLSLSLGIGTDLGSRTRSIGSPLAVSIDFLRSIGTGRAVIQVGASAISEIFLYGLGEIHAAAGVQQSVGPVLVSGVVGPSVVFPDGDDARVVPGVHAALRAAFVVVPKIGVGVEVFAHANAALPVVGVRGAFAFGRLPGALVPNPPPTPRQGVRRRGP